MASMATQRDSFWSAIEFRPWKTGVTCANQIDLQEVLQIYKPYGVSVIGGGFR